MMSLLEPGMFVRHPTQTDWGLGQVQSNIGGRVTVNFEHAGKVSTMLAAGGLSRRTVFGSTPIRTQARR